MRLELFIRFVVSICVVLLFLSCESEEADYTDSADTKVEYEDSSTLSDNGQANDDLGNPNPDGQKDVDTLQTEGDNPSCPSEELCPQENPRLCEPCQARQDCQFEDAKNECVDYGDEAAFCGSSCSTDDDCPEDYGCVESVTVEGEERTLCIHASGMCSCSDEAISAALSTRCLNSNIFGICEGTRECTETGLSECNAPVPRPDLCNGFDDDCDGVTDIIPCDDQNSCTEDSCGGAGGCLHTSTPGVSCSDGDENTQNDTCRADGSCVGTAIQCPLTECTLAAQPTGGDCAYEFAPAGSACDDTNPNTKNDSCDGEGTCSGTPYTCSPSDCEESSTPDGSTCSAIYKPSGSACDDSKNNTKNDACDGAGNCEGNSYTCSADQCETSSVPNGQNCTSTYKPAGASCDDNNSATINDQCDGSGHCSGEASGSVGSLVPCDNGSCWYPSLNVAGCSSQEITENYASGKFNVHAYSVSVTGQVPLEITFTKTAGSWQPALVVGASDGSTYYDGVQGIDVGYFNVEKIQTGKSGSQAKIRINAALDLDLVVYATAWHVIEGNFNPSISQSAQYSITASNLCTPSNVEQLNPCAQGSCWNYPGNIRNICACGAQKENFASGSYNVHRYDLQLAAGIKTTIRLRRTAGTWQPALVLESTTGITLSDGEKGAGNSTPGLEVYVTNSGKSGSQGIVEITSTADMDVVAYATAWNVHNSNFSAGLTQAAKYDLEVVVPCNDFVKKTSCGSPILHGIDISSHQKTINWTSVHNAGVDFAIIRASYGKAYLDPKFEENWQGSKAAGVVRAPYHFYRMLHSPAEQAQVFIDTVGTLQPGDLPPVLDVEHDVPAYDPTVYSAAQWRAAITTWLDLVEEGLGMKPIIYTSPGFWAFLNTNNFSEHILWVAHLTENNCPSVPGGWSDWAFWQYSWTGTIPGICADVDLDVFNGDMADLQMLTYP